MRTAESPTDSTRGEDGMIISAEGPIEYSENLIDKWAGQICFIINLRGSLIVPTGSLHCSFALEQCLSYKMCVRVCVCVRERMASPPCSVILNKGKIVRKFLSKVDCNLPCCLNSWPKTPDYGVTLL